MPTSKDMDRLYDRQLVKLKRSRENVDWAIVEERHEFLYRLYYSIRDWRSLLPNVRDIFRKEEIDFFLSDSIKLGCTYMAKAIVSFVARSGYRDNYDADVDAQRRTTPVHLVSKRRLCDWGVVAYWLFKIFDKFDVNFTDESGRTHFHVACEYGFDDVVRKFLELGQDPDCLVPETGDSPLHLAVAGGHAIVARTLLRRGAVPNLVNCQGSTPLNLICRKTSEDEAAMFLQIFHENSEAYRAESMANALNCSGDTELHVALNAWRRVLAEALLRYGADQNVANSRGLTPLHSICKRAEYDGMSSLLLRLVLENGEAVRINARNNEGDTPLHLALENVEEALKCVELLLRSGADPNLANGLGFTALHSIGKERSSDAMAKRFLRICEEIEQPLQLDVRDASGTSPLHYALLWDREASVIKLLLQAGASPDYPSGTGSTPLHAAVASLMPEAVQALLDRGADLAGFVFPTASEFDDRYEADLSASNYAFLRLVRTLDCIERLEARGRDSYELDKSGALTVVDFCRERGLFACQMTGKAFWAKDEPELVKKLKEDEMRVRDLCLVDLVGAEVEEAAKRVTYADCYEFSERLPKLPSLYHATCFRPLYEIISRRFLRYWAVELFMDMTRCRLPIVCCEKIIDSSFDNKNLLNICLAAKD
ncbi:ankyrin-2-like [Trichogramma pretiosum]|uniref:ankyrin-2-like n=1 Tax=Trichogramma pretiosum TaxID=7493 RepID=UPI000C71A999|nr:ankyrin-2-like [Trichogramma pretiosum]